MAEIWHNDGQGEASGTTITTTNGTAGGNYPVSAITIGAGNTAIFSNANPTLGTQSIRLTQSGANQVHFGVSNADPDATLWTAPVSWITFDFYFTYNQTPATTWTFLRLYSDDAYINQIASVLITTVNEVQIINTVGGQTANTGGGAERLVPGNDYLLRYVWDNTTLTQTVTVYNKGTVGIYTDAVLPISTGATVQAFRTGITTASVNVTMDMDLWVSSGGPLARKDLVTSNTPPSVSLGSDVTDIEPFSTVTITAIGTDVEGVGTIVSYNIYQISGSAVTLTPQGNTASYKAPGRTATDGVTLVFGATCTDNQGATSAEDTVTHHVLQVDRMMWNITGGTVYLEREHY